MKRNKLKSFSILLVIAILFTLSTIFVIGAITEDATENSYAKIVPYEDVANYRTNPEKIDGYVFAGWFSEETCDSATALSSDYTSGPAFAKYVPEEILGVKVQTTSKLWNSDTTDDSTGALRFVTSVDSLDYKEVGFIINIGGSDNYKSSKYVYQELYEEVGDGSSAKTNKYVPSELFHKSSLYFKTWTVTNINELKYLLEFDVTPYWVTLDGNTVTGSMKTVTVNQVRSWDYVFVNDNEDAGEDYVAIGTRNYPYLTMDAALTDMKNYRALAEELYTSDTTEGKDGTVCILESLTPTSDTWKGNGMDVIITSDVEDFSKFDISDTSTVANWSTLDYSAVQSVLLGDSVTFANMTLTLYGSSGESYGTNGAIYATGNRLKIAGSVTSENPYTTVYGGGSKGVDVSGTDVTILSGTYYAVYGGGRLSDVEKDTYVTLENTNVFTNTSGGKAVVFGGCNQGTVKGDTHVTIGQGFNSSYEEASTSHSKYSTVWGGGNGSSTTTSIVEGDTYVTVEGDARANFVSGGGFVYSEVKGTSHVILTGGNVMSVYGGSAGSSDTSKTNGINANTSVVMTGGEVSQVFGGNEYTAMEGNTSVQILGGKVTRRVYGGCYNNYGSSGWETTNAVSGYSSVTIGNAECISGRSDSTVGASDTSACAISRLKTNDSNEKAIMILNPGVASSDVGVSMKVLGSSISSANYANFLVIVDEGGTAYGEHNGLRIKPNEGKVATVRTESEDGEIVFYTESEGICALSKLGESSTSSIKNIYVAFEDAKPEGVNTEDCEAKVNGAYYDTLKEAVTAAHALAATTESTEAIDVYLLKDVEIEESLVIDDSVDIKIQSYTDSTTSATYTITYSNTDNNLFEVEGTLAVENLNLQGGKSGIYTNAGSVVTATNVNITRLSASEGPLIYVDADSSFTLNGEDGTSILDGATLSGQGVYVEGTFVMNGGTIQGNSVTGDGAGVHVPAGGNFKLTGGTIQGNSASACGGGVSVRGDFTMTGGTIYGNEANKGAGIILRNTAKANITDGTIQGNTAGADGGGMYLQSSDANTEINGVTIKENSAVNGGGIYLNVSTSEATIDAATIQNNTATTNGGGIYIYSATLVLKNGTIESNNAVTGGGVYVPSEQTFTMENGTIQNNTATSDATYTYGAGVYVAGEFVMNGGTISNHGDADNRSKSRGAGVCVYDGSFTMNDGTIAYNYASQAGAGVALETGTAKTSTFTMNGGTIANNNVEGAAGGVIVRASATFTMNGGSIQNNTASTNGGGLLVLGTATLVDGSITSNNADYGGGVYTNETGSFTMQGGSITSNNADSGGGVYTNKKSVFTMTDGTIATNTATAYGSGVYVNNEADYPITMSGGTISNHGSDTDRQASIGAGVYVAATAHFKLTGNGIVEANYTSENGAGVAVAGKLSYSGGNIQDNNATKDGGGVYVLEGGQFIMNTSQSIINNQAENGAGVYTSGTCNIKKGSIAENDATNGGGVYVNAGTFEMTTTSTKTITGNAATTAGAGVYVNAGTFNMENGTISNHGTSDDRSTVQGAGVYVASGATFNMSGDKTYVKENHTSAMGAGVTVEGTFNMNGGYITNNSSRNSTAASGEGAGVCVQGTGVVTMTAGYIKNNEVSGSGAGVSIRGTAKFTMDGGYISDNTADGSGGGIIVRSTRKETIDEVETLVAAFVMNDGTISGNKASVSDKNGGGAVFQSSGTMIEMNGGEISGNESNKYGGAIFANGGTAKFTMTGGTIKENKAASYGAGVYVNSGTFDMTGGTISAHGSETDRSASVGAGVYVNNSATFNMNGENAFIENNYSSTTGAGVAVAGTFTLTNGTIQGNNTTNSVIGGAGVYILTGGNFTMSGGKIYNNIALYHGGGIYQAGSLTITGGEITGNKATDSDNGQGGGIYIVSGAGMTMTGGTITGNHCGKNGGAIHAAGNNIIELEAGEISGNTADGTVQGLFVQNAKSTSQVTLHTEFVMGNEIRYNSLSTRGTDNPVLIVKGEIADDYTLALGFHSSGTVYIQCDSADIAKKLFSVMTQYDTKWTISYEDGSSYIKASK